MNIAFFTPININSAIGRSSCLVERALREAGHEVSLIRTEMENFFPLPTHPFLSSITSWTQEKQLRQILDQADAAVYQMGNNYEFHKGCLEWLPRAPGVAILHDYFLGNLFVGWAHEHFEEARSVLKFFYGQDADTLFFEKAQKSTFCEETVGDMPLCEWVAAQALSVILHSADRIDKILRFCPGSVKVADLPYNIIHIPDRLKDLRCEAPEKRLVFLTIGHANKNKRMEQVIKAMAANPALKKQGLYRLAGSITPTMREHLLKLAEHYEVDVEILGQVEDSFLQKLIHEADVMICLRYPTFESASASCIESLLNGKPTIVMNTGFYKELPDDIVIKINPENEIPELVQAMERLCAHPETRLILQQKGKEYAEHIFSAKNYAKILCDTIQEMNLIRPALAVIEHIADILRGWNSLAGMADNAYILHGLELFNVSPEPFLEEK